MIMREWCLRALVSIFEEHAYSNLYIQKHLHELSEQDRSLAVSIVYGTLQHQRYVRYQWAHMVQRSPKKQIALLLDMSIYQLLFLDALPDYAIIHEAVTIAARWDARAKGMVNGVLRRFQRDCWRAVEARPQAQAQRVLPVLPPERIPAKLQRSLGICPSTRLRRIRKR